MYVNPKIEINIIRYPPSTLKSAEISCFCLSYVFLNASYGLRLMLMVYYLGGAV